MATNPGCWFEIYVQDMKRAKKFYEAVLKVKLTKLAKTPEMWAFPQAFDKYGAGGALVKMEGFPPGGNSTLIYFGCKDCAVETQRVKAAGGKMVRDKFPIGKFGSIALALDTEGNMFGLHSTK